MHKIFTASSQIKPKLATELGKGSIELSHFEILSKLAEQNLIPETYIQLLNTLNASDDKGELAKKILKIYLYASTKLPNSNKVYQWLLKGPVPQVVSSDLASMSHLSQNIKRISSITKNRDKEIDRVTNTREKIQKKSTKKLEETISKSQEKLKQLNSQYDRQKKYIESIISEIETLLASERKL
jgi:flagellin-specific chaperone FliS